MSEWSGFDQRKVCSNCGGYQTRFGKTERTAASRQTRLLLVVSLFVTLLLLIISIAIILVKGIMPKPSQFIGLFLTVCLGLGSIVGYYLTSRHEKKDSSQDFKSQQSTVYSLTCMNCGYNWEMTADEWEMAGQREQKDLLK